jgi:hypothetical protein
MALSSSQAAGCKSIHSLSDVTTVVVGPHSLHVFWQLFLKYSSVAHSLKNLSFPPFLLNIIALSSSHSRLSKSKQSFIDSVVEEVVGLGVEISSFIGSVVEEVVGMGVEKLANFVAQQKERLNH